VAKHIAQLIETFYEELWNKWNDSAVEEILDPMFTFRGSLGELTSGPRGWRRYRDTVRQSSADFHTEIIDVVCDNRRAAARLSFTGTQTGPVAGLRATRRRRLVPGQRAGGSQAVEQRVRAPSYSSRLCSVITSRSLSARAEAICTARGFT